MDDVATPFGNFTVVKRNYGHWDITTAQYGRIFRIRGGPGDYWVADERPQEQRRQTQHFKTVGLCMAYICDELMYELIVAEGQQPKMIEAWNV